MKSITSVLALILLINCQISLTLVQGQSVLDNTNSNTSHQQNQDNDPMRFTFEYLVVEKSYPQTKLVGKILQVASSFFEKLISVKSSSKQPIYIKDCYVKFKDFTIGVTPSVIDNSDFHLMVDIRNDDSDSYVRSTICSQSDKDGRSLVGYITFNEKILPSTKDLSISSFEFDRWVKMTIREIFNVLVFDDTLLKRFAGFSPDTYGIDQKGNSFVAFPEVLLFARQHFGCDSIQKVYLKKEYNDSKLLWDKTYFFNDLMTTFEYSSEVGWSAINNALLKDCGWFTLNTPLQDNLYWGLNKGCDFYNKLCLAAPTPSEFCSSNSSNNDYQNFMNDGYMNQCSASTFGSCNYVKPSNDYNRSCQWAPKSRNSREQQLEIFGSSFDWNSRGFVSTLKPTKVSAKPDSSSVQCYPQSCFKNSDKWAIDIQIGISNKYPQTVVCEISGESKSVKDYDGAIICPNIEEFCERQYTCQNFCNQNGYCVNQSCHCLPGYSGQDCQDGTSTQTLTLTSGKPLPPPSQNPSPQTSQTDSKSNTSSSKNSDETKSISESTSSSQSSTTSSSKIMLYHILHILLMTLFIE